MRDAGDELEPGLWLWLWPWLWPGPELELRLRLELPANENSRPYRTVAAVVPERRGGIFSPS